MKLHTILFQKKKNRLETCKWLGIAGLLVLATAIAGTIGYDEKILPFRILFIIILIIAAASLALLTTLGASVLTFLQQSYTEMRKIIWPTRQETLQTTLIVTLVTALMSLILWGLDGAIVRLVSLITELRF
ncbi:preprotein translocase subunit SecE [Candidatus Erwinia haradaeae]|uniref:Protein translocase subunit SecE n=1 Tax=Candidatus Erwinia haradaeae TaxID=1922217 RepID=A0A451DA11_9GAMM|nr:preprotein translocase subunit SecE [Candidatus Erwinia haradaeae]VFP83184.1 Protein translocase subunit SecE [Candidatus Erwinia haradaeae]